MQNVKMSLCPMCDQCPEVEVAFRPASSASS